MRAAVVMAVAALVPACAFEPEPRSPGPRRTLSSVARQQMPVRGAPRPVPGQRGTGAESTERALPVAAEPDASDAAVPVTSQSSPVYRVTADGTVGCEDPTALRLLRGLRETGGAGPRLLAQAHRDGRCMTVFRMNEWSLENVQGDMAKLRLISGSGQGRPVSLYFLRSEVSP
jgi:hypothetical protein